MATTTESAIQRSMQAYCLQLSDACSLEWGVAYTCPRFARLDVANQLREVIVERPEDVSSAFSAAEAYFAERGTRCLRWSAALDEPIDEMASFLAERGFRREDFSVMAVRGWVEIPVREAFRVLPARAMRKALAAILRRRYGEMDPTVAGASVEASMERLDEAQMEGFVAMCGSEAVGWCSFFEVGDIGMVTDLFVAASHRRRGVGTALMGHTLKLARRLLKRVTCVRVGADQTGAIELFRRCGLEVDGAVVEFVRD